jgi:hypothetical protein
MLTDQHGWEKSRHGKIGKREKADLFKRFTAEPPRVLRNTEHYCFYMPPLPLPLITSFKKEKPFRKPYFMIV